MDDTILISHKSIARGYIMCTWILITKAWKELSEGSQQFDKAQCKTSSICVYGFQDNSSYGFVRTLAYQRGVLQRVFQIFKKISQALKHQEWRSCYSNHISNINYLDKHGFLRIFVHKHQGDKHGIKHWWFSQTTRWLAEFGVLALSLVMLVQTMLCDASVGDLK